MSNQPPKRRLLRSRDERMLAGVAGGLAQYLDIDPTLVRVGFVVAALFGGLGIVAYLVLAVVTPNDDGSGAPVRGERPSPWLVIIAVLAALIVLPGPLWGPFDWGAFWWWVGSLWLLLVAGGAAWLYMTLRERDRRGSPSPSADPPAGGGPDSPSGEAPETPSATTRRLEQPGGQAGSGPGGSNRLLRAIALAVLVLAGLSLAGMVATASAWATATGHGALVAGAVIAIGAALVVAGFAGGARWLIVPALVLALPAGAVAAADLHFDGEIGEREYRPTSIAAIPDEGYSLGVGQLTVDLRELPWRRGRSLEVKTDMGIGQTVVSVPSRVCVEPDARASIGDVFVRGQRSSGVEPELVDDPPRDKAPRLLLDSEVDVGRLAVTDRPPEALTGGHGRFGRRGLDGVEANEEERSEAQRACSS